MRHHHQSLAIAFQLVLGVLVWQTSGLTCIVSEANETLEACFRSSATDIVLRGDHFVGQAFAQYATAPLELQRNVTLRGPPGTQADDRPVLDFGLVDGAVELCSSCMISIQDLVLKQERRGSGPTYDFFTGQSGSRIRSIRTYRIRAGCTPAPVQIRALEALKRSSLFPNSTSSQHVELRNVSYKGKVYVNSVWSVDITFDVARRVDEGPSGSEGGYAQMSQNSVRLCEAYVSLDCLAVKSADTCVSELREGMPTAQQPAGLGRNAAVAIIVPLVIGFMLAAGLVGWWAKRRCIGKSPDPVPVALKSYKSRRSFNRTASRCTTSGDDSESSSTFGSSAGPCLGKPLASNAGWELMDCKTSPLLGRVDDSTVDLGALVGSGSFGKVFKGQWNGMDVAVKVIEHSGTSAAAVQHELELMMALQHPNIVRAYHCLTYVHTDCLETECSISTTASLRNSSFVSPSGTSFNQRLMHSSGSFTAARLASSSTASMHTAAAAAAAGATAPATASATGTLGCPCLGKSSVSPCAPVCGDAVLTITADAAYGRQQPCHCCQNSSTAALAAQEVQVQGSRPSQEGSPFAAMAGSTGAGVNMGSGSSRQTQAGVTDSMGSSVDCRCTAGELRTSKSLKEPSKRFESWLVLEYCDCGNLSSYLANWPPLCSSRCESTMLRLLQLLQDTANGLQELHHQQVVHGDLNARNVLVASSSEASIGVQGKLADLGLSRSVTQYKTHRTTNTVGTMSHTAPEMLRLGYMSVAADVYALGIMMWELYTGEDAFQRLQHPGQFFETVVLQDLRPVIPHGMPADYQLLMQHCWATEPDARPSISRVLECLQYMISERQQHKARGSMDVQAGGPGRLAASAPLPLLLQSAPPRKQHWWQLHAMQRLSLMKMLGSETSNSQPGTVPPSQASSGALPSFAAHGGYLDLSPPNSNTLLPVLDAEEASDVQPAATLHQQQQPQQDAARGSGPDVPPGYNSQPLPAFMNNSFSFYRRTGPSRPSTDLQCCSREGSNSKESATSSGKLPTFLQSLRQGSFSMRDVSFSSSARQGSQTGSIIGDHAWFV